jgi:hypothetical protein
MKHDHALRLCLSLTFFVLGIFALGSAFVPAQSEFKDLILASACVALAISAILTRLKFTSVFMTRAPSGPVGPLKAFFAFVGLAAIVPAILGLGLFLNQAPLGLAPSTFPGALLAVFSLFPLASAYLTLAASGRRIGGKGRRVGP